MSENLRANGNLVDTLGASLRRGGSALANAPELLRQALESGAWREFTTQRGDHVRYARFSEFVTTPPLHGLGASMEIVERIVGTDDPDLLVMLREAEKVGQGARTDLQPRDDSSRGHGNGQSDYLADRLARDAPELYAAVKAGMSLSAAAIAAGIRPRRISVRLDNPRSIAQSLRRHLAPELIVELRALLEDGRSRVDGDQ